MKVHLELSRHPVATDAVARQGMSGKVVDLAAYRRQARLPEMARLCRIAVTCRNYMVGRDDWNRGIRALFRSFAVDMDASWAADGSLRLHDFPLGELVLSADDVAAATASGLQIRLPDFEADIAVEDFRAALAPLAGRNGLQFMAS